MWRGEFQRTRRRIRRTFLVPALATLAACFGLVAVSVSTYREMSIVPIAHRRVARAASYAECLRRKLAANESSEQFPPDLFTLEQRRHGAIILHLGGLVYMFVALAVVCDEFFVPSLAVLIEVLGISEDVAGATFMAAGGSAPEFFTSVFGVFVAQNNVGIGTIVGSATFNILCVLAFCTLFSREVLHLTWWPLFRDMTFYIIALLFLVIFFSDEKISWHEALTMFLIYIIYGIFMKYNTQVEMTVKAFLKGNRTSQMNSIASPSDVGPQYNREHRRSIPMIHGGTQLRNGLAQMAIGSDDEESETTPNENGNVTQVQTINVKPASEKMFVKTNNRTITTVSAAVDGHGNKVTPIENPTPKPQRTVQNGSGQQQPSNGLPLPPPDKQSMTTGDEQPLDLSWPETHLKRFIFVLLAPITFPLALTLPDVRKPSWRSWFIVTFVGSVLWIALYSYLMVWWANTIGETFAIPTEIMGLTILAAGTSIPDLITSVIVARKGLGDMAVSSSIGSNLFDICVGLPIPWLLYFIVALFRWSSGSFPTVAVISNGLICSVGMLFLMLVFLVFAIAMSRWRMDKIFGFVMIIAYVAFCIFSVFLETGQIVCPLRISEAC
ncbi:unnamed protein product [Cylicocyclus nassatus]|uniref:Sodium/calcium exchanger membrane region domain-containing protein n=1 Tax=Cylicocyclus nassatus TaxID=53992 RepID=A0AA36GE69_CYLNA|nr:unnamed protein product [Cylicocyclus nassatus]